MKIGIFSQITVMKLSGVLLGTLIASSTAMAAPNAESVVSTPHDSQEIVKEKPDKRTGKQRRADRKNKRQMKHWMKHNAACGMG